MKFFLSILVAFTTLSSSYATTKEPHSETPSHNHKANHENHHLSLNHGAKWVMDAHTREMFETMTQRLESNSKPELLGSQLDEDIKKLIKGCTMTGRAHDQLHLYLTSLIPAIEALKSEQSMDKLHAVKHALNNYKRYFE